MEYRTLPHGGDKVSVIGLGAGSLHEGDCVGCGHCDSRCPFQVRQADRMGEIAAWFGQ